MNNNKPPGKYSKNREDDNINHNSIENDSNDQNNETSITNEPFFVMTLEFKKGEFKKIKIFPSSDPSEIAFNFCKENNLDFESLKYLTTEISLLLTKYKSNQLDISPQRSNNNSIEEVGEELDQSNNTKERKKTIEGKLIEGDNSKGFIYNSLDSGYKGHKKNSDAVQKEIDEEAGDDNNKYNQGYEYSKEYFTNTSMKNVMKIMKKKEEISQEGRNNHKEEMKKNNEEEEEVCLNVNKADHSKSNDDPSKNSYSQNEESKFGADDEDNNKMPNEKDYLNNYSNIQANQHEIKPLTSNKVKKYDTDIKGNSNNHIVNKEKTEPNLRHISKEKSPITKIKQNKENLQQQVFNTKNIEAKKIEKNMILHEKDYNFPDEESKRKDLTKENSTKISNGNAIGMSHQLINEANIEIISKPRRYCALTEETTTDQFIVPAKSSNSTTRNNYRASSNLNYSRYKNDNNNNNSNHHLMSHHQDSSLLLKPEKSVDRSSSTNVFQKLFNEAEIKRKLFKRPCHFSSRHYNITQSNSYSKSNVSHNSQKNSILNLNSNAPMNYKKIPQTKQSKGIKQNSLSSNRTKMKSSFSFSSKNNNINILEPNNTTEPNNIYQSSNKSQSRRHSRKNQPNKCLAKENLSNPFLNRKLCQMQNEFKLRYPFKPQINHNYDFEPGLSSFLERQELYEEIHQSNKRKIENEEHKLFKPRKHSTKQIDNTSKGDSIFKKNYDFARKYKTNRSLLYNKYQSDLNEPFKCTSQSNDIFNKKKEKAFSYLFNQLDSDEDGLITSINISTKTIPNAILMLITPLIEYIQNEIFYCDLNNFIIALNELYMKMDLRDKRALIEYFAVANRKTKGKTSPMEKNEHKSSRYKSFGDNKTLRLAENHDRRVSHSFSENNIIINNPTVIHHKAYFRPYNSFNDAEEEEDNNNNNNNSRYYYHCINTNGSSNSNIRKYTFETYKNHLSYNY